MGCIPDGRNVSRLQGASLAAALTDIPRTSVPGRRCAEDQFTGLERSLLALPPVPTAKPYPEHVSRAPGLAASA